MSKSKPKKLEDVLLSEVVIEQYPEGKVVYSLAQKQSDSGVFSNKRLLIFHSKERYIGYSNILPANMPYGSLAAVTTPKKRVLFENAKFQKSKTRSNTLEIICSKVEYKGTNKKETWMFTMKTKEMVEKWVAQLQHFKQYPQEAVSQAPEPLIKKSNSPGRELLNNQLSTKQPGFPGKTQSKPNITNIEKKSSAYAQQAILQQRPRQPSYSNVVTKQMTVVNKQTQYRQEPITEVKNNSIVQTQPIEQNKVEPVAVQTEDPKPTVDIVRNQSEQRKTIIYASSSHVDKSKASLREPIYQQPIEYPKKQVYSNKFEYRNQVYQPARNQVAQNYEEIKKQPSQSNIQPQSKSSVSQMKYSNVQQNVQSNLKDKYLAINSSPSDWNLELFFSGNPLDVINNFAIKAEATAKLVIDELTTNPNFRKVEALQDNELYSTYEFEGLHIKLLFSPESGNQQGFFLNETQLRAAKNEFKNYNYFINKTQNKGLIRVPLVALVNYKGLTAFVKAIVQNSKQIAGSSLVNQLLKLEKSLKIKKQVLVNRDNAIFKYVAVQNVEIIYIDDLKTFLPLDFNAVQQDVQYRSEILEECPHIITVDKNIGFERRIDKATQKVINDLEDLNRQIKSNCDKVLAALQNLDIVVLCERDLIVQLHKHGINKRFLTYFYKNTQVELLKRYFVSEMAAGVALEFLNNHIQTQINEIASRKSHKLKQFEIDEILMEGACNFINDLLSNTQNTEKLWKLIFIEIKKKYSLISNKDQITFGYFLSSFFSRSNLKYNYELFLKQRDGNGLLSRQFLLSFQAKTVIYDLNFITRFSEMVEIIKQQPSESGFDTILDLLNLRESPIPEYLINQNLFQQLSLYLANFISADVDKEMVNQYRHLQLYQLINKVPPSLASMRLSLMAIKWAIKRKQEKVAIEIFENASQLISFWGGEFHPLLGDFYDFFSLYYVTNGEYQEAITLAKSSLVNTIKIIGGNSLSTAQKYYQLGNIFFKIGRKQEALSHYLKTKDILNNNKKSTIPEYAVISLKLSLLYLNFGKINDAIDLAYQCLKIFESNASTHEQEMLETFEILARSYEITQQKNQALDLAVLCSQKLNHTEDPKVFERMLKLGLYPHLHNLSVTLGKQLLSIVQNLPIQKTAASYNSAFNYLYKRAQSENITETLLTYFDKIDKLSNDILSKDLLKKHKGLESDIKSEAQDLLVLLEAVLYMIDESYIVGILREYEY